MSIFILFLMLVLAPAHAHAYINPGAGSAVLAIILAGLSGAGILWRVLRLKVVRSFCSKRRSDSD